MIKNKISKQKANKRAKAWALANPEHVKEYHKGIILEYLNE